MSEIEDALKIVSEMPSVRRAWIDGEKIMAEVAISSDDVFYEKLRGGGLRIGFKNAAGVEVAPGMFRYDLVTPAKQPWQTFNLETHKCEPLKPEGDSK